METVVSADRSPLSLLQRRLAPQFERRVVVLAPDHRRIYDAAEWRDAIVVVEQGQIELECVDGSRRCFARGAVLCLDRLPLRAIHNRGAAPAALVAVSRRALDDTSAKDARTQRNQ
jgi:hypothetical protein